MAISLLDRPYTFFDDQVGLLAKCDDGNTYRILVSTDWLDDHIVDTPIESESEEQSMKRYFAGSDQNRKYICAIANAKFAKGDFKGREIRICPGDEL